MNMKRRRKRWLIGMLATLVCFTGQAQRISFARQVFDFGQIREVDGPVVCDFYFMNTGERPLVIKEVVVSCGCTSSEWSSRPYQPGEKGVIRMVYHPEGRTESSFHSVAEVYTNAVKSGRSDGVFCLEISGNVERGPLPEINAYRMETWGKKEVTMGERMVEADDLGRIRNRVREWLLGQITDAAQHDKEVKELVGRMRREGYWDDIDYACYCRTNWEPMHHLGRMKSMAQAYLSPQSDYYQHDSLFEAVRSGMAYWNRKDPKSHNWWQTQIGGSQLLGEILILMDAGKQVLPEALTAGLTRKMERSDPRKWTGANKLDIAIHHMHRGCLLRNDSIVKASVEQIFYPVQITDKEGIQEDFSYHQHGNQLYIGGYGTVFVNGITVQAWCLDGTAYALDPERLGLFSRFVRETYLMVLRGKYADFSVTGRGLSRQGALDYGSVGYILRMLADLDKAHAGEYQAALLRLDEPKSYRQDDRNRMYWRSDYILHNRKEYDFSVRTASVRTSKTESGNGENLLGTFLSDGATSIRVNGNEYFDIFPVWEWNKIPGVTAPDQMMPMKAVWGVKGTSDFTGGVSDGLYGAMAFDLNDYNVRARKAWFCFDEEVVCLGAGIGANASEKMITSVNQCCLDGPVTISRNGSVSVLDDGEYLFTGDLKWILHDSIVYFFPEKSVVCLKKGVQSGSWATINYNYPSDRIDKKVFNLWLDHGVGPENGKYAYILLPGKKEVGDVIMYDTGNIRIEQNDTTIQAVVNRKLDMLQVVFYHPATFDNGTIRLSVDKPCVVMIGKAGSRQPELTVGNPVSHDSSVTVRFNNGKKRIIKY